MTYHAKDGRSYPKKETPDEYRMRRGISKAPQKVSGGCLILIAVGVTALASVSLIMIKA